MHENTTFAIGIVCVLIAILAMVGCEATRTAEQECAARVSMQNSPFCIELAKRPKK
jgi:hypothetical protein